MAGTGTCWVRGSVTWAMLNSATSFWPRDRLRCTASSRPGSSVVAIACLSASSGFSTLTVLRRESFGISPNESNTAGEMNGNGSTSV